MSTSDPGTDPFLSPPLDGEQLALLRRYGQERPTSVGQVLFREGDRAYDFIVVLSGTVSGPNTETCAGQGLDRVFCTNCGARVFTDNLKDGSGIVFVQEGTLDRLDEWFAPKVEIFTWSRQKWGRPLEVPQFDHGPR